MPKLKCNNKLPCHVTYSLQEQTTLNTSSELTKILKLILVGPSILHVDFITYFYDL